MVYLSLQLQGEYLYIKQNNKEILVVTHCFVGSKNNQMKITYIQN